MSFILKFIFFKRGMFLLQHPPVQTKEVLILMQNEGPYCCHLNFNISASNSFLEDTTENVPIIVYQFWLSCVFT